MPSECLPSLCTPLGAWAISFITFFVIVRKLRISYKIFQRFPEMCLFKWLTPRQNCWLPFYKRNQPIVDPKIFLLCFVNGFLDWLFIDDPMNYLQKFLRFSQRFFLPQILIRISWLSIIRFVLRFYHLSSVGFSNWFFNCIFFVSGCFFENKNLKESNTQNPLTRNHSYHKLLNYNLKANHIV